MDSDELKRFLTTYFAFIAPAIILLLAIFSNAGVMWYLLLIVWLCAGLMIVFLPSHPEKESG